MEFKGADIHGRALRTGDAALIDRRAAHGQAGAEINSVCHYSTGLNSWTPVAAMPIATAGSTTAYGQDGKIYVVGGLAGGVATNAVQVYDPAADTWTISTPLPEPLSGSAMSVDSLGRLIVMGGQDINSNDVAEVWRSQELGVPDAPPVFTQWPATNATYHQPYSSLIRANGNFRLTASQPGATNETVTLQATTDPADPASWATIGSFLPVGDPFTFTDTNSAGYPYRFYRLVTP